MGCGAASTRTGLVVFVTGVHPAPRRKELQRRKKIPPLTNPEEALDSR
jgi:hypothetical protein